MQTDLNVINEDRITYLTVRVKDIHVAPPTEVATPQPTNRINRINATGATTINDMPVIPTKRFWWSLRSRFGFSANIFRYFSHSEVFNRISERAPNDEVRVCIDNDAAQNKRYLLAVTNPNVPVITAQHLRTLLGNFGFESASYDNGILQSTHSPRIGNRPIPVLGDDFCNRFVIDTPIDGFGRPAVYLSLLRLVCANGAIGYAKSFRSEITLGSRRTDDPTIAMARAMENFNNEDGFIALRQRFEAAGNSWASMYECNQLYRALLRTNQEQGLLRRGREIVQTKSGPETVDTAMPIFRNFGDLTGDMQQMYGVVSLGGIPSKRQRLLTSKCRVYDLLNFASEVATHHTTPSGARRLQAFIGDLLTTEYDLDGTAATHKDWKDLFIPANATGSV